MSVLIKGMSGYECCADCEFCGGLTIPDDIYTCDCPSTRGMNITRAIEEDCRHPDCPLVGLPEKHGRLIDADKLFDAMKYSNWKILYSSDGTFLDISKFSEIIRNIPTIVESEDKEQ